MAKHIWFAHPPDIPENVRAQYFHRPARKVVIVQDKSHTATKDFDERDVEEEVAGISRARNVEKCTISMIRLIGCRKTDGTYHQKRSQQLARQYLLRAAN